MRRLLEIIAIIALLDLGGSVASADDPTISARPDVRPDPHGSAVGRLGVLYRPSTATETASVELLGAGLIAAGLVLLRKRPRT